MATNYADELERRVGALLDRIPGYRGYRSKEDRRDADRRLREHLVAVYGAEAERVEQVARQLADQRRLTEISPVDDFARSLRHFIDRVRVATYGYGGLMGDRDVGPAALDQLRLFDESLLAGVDEVQGPIAALESAAASGGDLATPARSGSAVVRTLLARLDLRDEVIESGMAAAQESVLRVLEPPTAATSAAYDLRPGDALSILDDDFLVDARIAVDGEPTAFRLLRLGGPDADWLFAPRDATLGLARVRQVTAPAAGRETSIDGDAFTLNLSGSGDGEVSGTGRTSGPRAVRFQLLVGSGSAAARAVVLDWGTERQAFVGREVHPNDVEVFGRPSTELN